MQDFVMSGGFRDLQGTRTAIKEQEGKQIFTSPLQQYC